MPTSGSSDAPLAAALSALPPGRRLWAGLELLDHQIEDRDGRLAGKVDDLEFDEPGAGTGDLPVLRVLVTGAGGLAAQLGGAAGRWLAAAERRLAADADTGGVPGVPWSLVGSVDTAVHVSASRGDLVSNRAEQWAREVLVERIPGAGHAAE